MAIVVLHSRLYTCINSTPVADSFGVAVVQIAEAAVGAVGKLCVGESDSSCFESQAIEALLKLVTNKRQELHFTVGDAFAMSCARWHPETHVSHRADVEPFKSTIEKIIGLIEAGGPTERCVANRAWVLSNAKQLSSDPVPPRHQILCLHLATVSDKARGFSSSNARVASSHPEHLYTIIGRSRWYGGLVAW
jgi:hypothetical protein